MTMLAKPYRTALEAIRNANKSDGEVAITLDGMNLVISKTDAEAMETDGTEFAYLFEKDGRVMTVPVN